MDLTRMIAELKAEKQLLEQAMAALERLAANSPRHGRPPNWLKGQIQAAPTGRRKKSPGAHKRERITVTGT